LKFGSETDGSHTDVSKINKTGSTPGHPSREKGRAATSNQTSSKTGGEGGGKGFEVSAGAAGAVPVVPGRLGGNRRNDSERAGDSVCMSVLHRIAPRVGSGAGIQKSTPRAMDQNAQGRGIG
jgi:hypothetical protein